jgi:hypothetical protein
MFGECSSLHGLGILPSPFSFTALSPAIRAVPGRRIDLAFGNFIPPFLLGRPPGFLCAATCALKCLVNVVATRDEVGLSIAVAGSEGFSIHTHGVGVSDSNQCLVLRLGLSSQACRLRLRLATGVEDSTFLLAAGHRRPGRRFVGRLDTPPAREFDVNRTPSAAIRGSSAPRPRNLPSLRTRAKCNRGSLPS